MENVKGMANKIREIKDDFSQFLGDDYQFDYKLLKAQDFGVPQNRERFIMIGNRIGINPELIFEEIFKHKRASFVLRDALEGLPHLEARKEKGASNIENIHSGFTIREFDYPDTEFYHFINGDRSLSMLYNHKNRITILAILRFIEDCPKEPTHCMNLLLISCHIPVVMESLRISILNSMKIKYARQ